MRVLALVLALVAAAWLPARAQDEKPTAKILDAVVKLHTQVPREARTAPYLGTAPALIVCVLLAIIAFYVMTPIASSNPLPTADAMPLAFAGVLIGFFIMVDRRRAVTQILGFLMLENGIFLLALLTTYGVPFIVEMGVFLDVLVAVLIMEVFVYHIKDNFDSIDVGELGKLKE